MSLSTSYRPLYPLFFLFPILPLNDPFTSHFLFFFPFSYLFFYIFPLFLFVLSYFSPQMTTGDIMILPRRGRGYFLIFKTPHDCLTTTKDAHFGRKPFPPPPKTRTTFLFTVFSSSWSNVFLSFHFPFTFQLSLVLSHFPALYLPVPFSFTDHRLTFPFPLPFTW
jgi:hypothetical protein